MTYQPPPPPGQPQPAPGFYPPQQAPKKKRTGLTLGIVGGALALCCGGVAIAAVAGGGDKPSTSVTTKAPATAGKAPAKKQDEPAADEGGKFNLKPGATLTVTDGGDVHEVTVKSVKSVESGCSSLQNDPEKGYYVIADVAVRVVSGTASVNPLFFEFVADDGTTSDGISGSFSGCADSALTSAVDLRAGQKRAGQVVFDASSTKGQIEYGIGAFGSDTVGSWKTN